MGKSIKKERFEAPLTTFYEMLNVLGYKEVEVAPGYTCFENQEIERAYAITEVVTIKGPTSIVGWAWRGRARNREEDTIAMAAMKNASGRSRYLTSTLEGFALKEEREGSSQIQIEYARDKWTRAMGSLNRQRARLQS